MIRVIVLIYLPSRPRRAVPKRNCSDLGMPAIRRICFPSQSARLRWHGFGQYRTAWRSSIQRAGGRYMLPILASLEESEASTRSSSAEARRSAARLKSALFWTSCRP